MVIKSDHEWYVAVMTSIGDALVHSLSWEHERVQLVQDAEIGLRGVIAIHSTVLGPRSAACGSVRTARPWRKRSTTRCGSLVR